MADKAPNPHTKKIQFERELMLATGLTRGQVRQGLEAQAKADRQERQNNQESRPVSTTFAQNNSSAELRPAPFASDGRAGGSQQGGDNSTLETFYVAINGTLYTAEFKLTGDPEVV